jgi:hypothetical protein
MLWVARTSNRKTGCLPTAYVGTTIEETIASCKSCSLLGDVEERPVGPVFPGLSTPVKPNGACYAWGGLVAHWGLPRILRKFKASPEKTTIAYALKHRRKDARAARLAALGDPSRALGLVEAIVAIRAEGLAVLGYTHHWRRAEGRPFRLELMASTDDLAQADQALAAGWRPTVVLPWQHQGATFVTPGGARGVVCPAQRKDAVTCNTCRMCDPKHPVWEAGQVELIGFMDHGPQARGQARRVGRRLPSAGAGDRWNGPGERAAPTPEPLPGQTDLFEETTACASHGARDTVVPQEVIMAKKKNHGGRPPGSVFRCQVPAA